MVSDQSIFATTASRLAPEGHPFAAGMPPPESRSPMQSAPLAPVSTRRTVCDGLVYPWCDGAACMVRQVKHFCDIACRSRKAFYR